MKAGPKAAVDPTVLPFRPQSTGAARFAKFCERFVKVPKGRGGSSPTASTNGSTSPYAKRFFGNPGSTKYEEFLAPVASLC
jgi:hypothetical protein